MKLSLVTDEALTENEILIKCSEVTDEVLELQRQINNLVRSSGTIQVTGDNKDYFLKYTEIIFMETAGSKVAIHTRDRIFFVKKKLYELEEEMPTYFMRVSKSTIVNLKEIRSIEKNIAGASQLEFAGSNKITFVSRNYYKSLMDRLSN